MEELLLRNRMGGRREGGREERERGEGAKVREEGERKRKGEEQ